MHGADRDTPYYPVSYEFKPSIRSDARSRLRQLILFSLGANDTMEDADARAKADQLHLQAAQRYTKINAHIKVYGSRNAETEQLVRNGFEFVEAALKLFPTDAPYLNTYALLLADGLGHRELAMEALERAIQIDPDNIQIRQNIRDLTAAGPAPRALSAGAVVTVFVLLAVIAIIAIALASH